MNLRLFRRRIPSIPFGTIVAATTLALLSGLVFCYGVRADSCAAVTVFPVWIWELPLLFGAAVGWRCLGRHWGVTLLSLSLLFGLRFAEEPGSMARAARRQTIRTIRMFAEEPWDTLRASSAPELQFNRTAGGVRVISLNCGGGLPEAAAEVERWNPDVVLLQEVPSRAAVTAIARRLFGTDAGVVWGYDTAILARRASAVVPPLKHRSFVIARVNLPDGSEAEVVSLRLTPPLVRMDLWSPDCWGSQRENRMARRAELAEILDELSRIPQETPLLVGGDFNVPAGDAVPAMLSPRLRDSFRQAGLGWGNTGLNDLPVTRIDQVWISRHWRARAVIASKTRFSDHRMVICQLAPLRANTP